MPAKFKATAIAAAAALHCLLDVSALAQILTLRPLLLHAA
jgi:hypothetical protein